MLVIPWLLSISRVNIELLVKSIIFAIIAINYLWTNQRERVNIFFTQSIKWIIFVYAIAPKCLHSLKHFSLKLLLFLFAHCFNLFFILGITWLITIMLLLAWEVYIYISLVILRFILFISKTKSTGDIIINYESCKYCQMNNVWVQIRILKFPMKS